MLKKFFRSSGPLLVLSFAILGCNSTPRSPGTVVFASGADLESGNPLVTIHPLSKQIQRHALFTTLARYDSLLQPEPYLARSWEWSANRRELTFHLVPGVAWHDGEPTTARDVAFTLMAAREQSTGYPRAGDLASLDTVIVVDDTTAILRFLSPVASFPLVLCELPPVPAHLLADVPLGQLRQHGFNFSPVGNGPFRFAERVPGQRWRFVRNDAFPPSLGGPPLIDELVIAVVDEPTTKLAGLASGDLDFAGIAPSMAALADEDPAIVVRDYSVLFSVGLVLNTHAPPFDDVLVRRAVDLALDRDRIVDAALAGFGIPAAGPVPLANPYALQIQPVRDPVGADSLLSEAGWIRNAEGFREKDGTVFTVEMLTVGSGDLAIEQLVQSDLRARGLQVQIRSMEMGAFLTRARADVKDFDIIITGIPGDVSLAHLAGMYDSRQSGGSLDYSDFHTRELDRLFDETRGVSGDRLPQLWGEVQNVLAREVPMVWIYHARGVQGVAARMQGVIMDLRGELVSVARWHSADIAR